jgi:hypothetical protein
MQLIKLQAQLMNYATTFHEKSTVTQLKNYISDLGIREIII